MDTVQWRVEIVSPPKAVRRCRRCGAKAEFESSGQFRVNANGKSLDVWLIYRCAGCKATWNMEILSRVRPDKVRPRLELFLENDPMTALGCAMDGDVWRRNGVLAQGLVYQIVGGDVEKMGTVAVEIRCNYPLEVKVARLVREKLGLSASAFDVLTAAGHIRMADGADIRKSRLGTGCTVLVEAANLPCNRG